MDQSIERVESVALVSLSARVAIFVVVDVGGELMEGVDIVGFRVFLQTAKEGVIDVLMFKKTAFRGELGEGVVGKVRRMVLREKLQDVAEGVTLKDLLLVDRGIDALSVGVGVVLITDGTAIIG